MENKYWSITEAWNRTLDTPNSKPFEPRSILFASEIGRSFIDVYWSMKGIVPTNPFNDRRRRCMEAGNFFESIVVWVIQRCGMLIETQAPARMLNDERYLPVYGRIDLIAGSDGDWTKREQEINNTFLELDRLGFKFPFLNQVKRLSFSLIEHFKEKYPEGLEPRIIEIKSLNSMAFWKKDEPISKPYEHHENQLTFYQMFNEKEIRVGSFLYGDRDTLSINEIFNPIKEEVKKRIFDWLEKMTYYYRNDIQPPLPEPIIFDERKKQYSYNWEIDRSNYRDLILKEFGKSVDSIKKEVNEKNKLLKQRMLMRFAFEGKEKYGSKKYKTAIEMVEAGNSIADVEKKLSIPKIVLDYYQELKNKQNV